MHRLLLLAAFLVAQDGPSADEVERKFEEALRAARSATARREAARKALAELEPALSSDRKDDRTARVVHLAARIHTFLDDEAAVIRLLRRFLETWPDHPEAADARFFLGEALLHDGQDAAAREAFADFTKRHPSDERVLEARIRSALSYVTENKPKEAGDAFETLRSEYRDKPESWMIGMRWAAALHVLDRTEEARAVLEDVVRRSPHLGMVELAKRVLANWIWVGKAAPSVSDKDLQDRPFSLADQKGKVVLLYFFSAGAQEAEIEAGIIRRLKEAFPATDLAVFGICIDREQAMLDRLIEDEKIDWPICRDGAGLDGRLAGALNLKGLPMVLLIDRAGVIRYVNPIFTSSGREMRLCVERLVRAR